MLNIGCHLSVSKGYAKAVETALTIDADTFQFFTRNPRGGKAKKLDPRDLEKAKVLLAENDFRNLLAHAPYTMNLCSQDENTREFARGLFQDDLERLEQLPASLYVFHPGSHTGLGAEEGIRLISEALNDYLTPAMTTTVLLETMSGKGSEVGKTFEEIGAIIEAVNLKDKIGVCWDTCHLLAAGYDLKHDLEGVIKEFDEIVGLKRLKAVHLNDSLMPFASHKDRHAPIGEGELGLEALVAIINHPDLKHLPFFLETPQELPGYAREIELLKSYYQD